MSSLNEVILEIEGASLKCSRKELSEHSDYFKIMFEADFLERDKHKIKLEVNSLSTYFNLSCL